MGAKNNKQRRYREKTGRRSEALAAMFLRLKGYRILARNFRHRHGEIDIIAMRARLLVFVEVKQRTGAAADLDAVTPMQWRRIEAAANAFVGRHQELRNLPWRFDFIGFGRWVWPRHKKAVWRF
ncbi:MAG: YraN family protein [Parvibaculales bacterium]